MAFSAFVAAALAAGAVFSHVALSRGATALTRTLPSDQSALAQFSDPKRIEVARVAEEHLKFLYTMYFAVRGCTEASELHGRPEYRPTVTVEDARRIMATVEFAAREVGLRVEEAWREASPIGQTTAEGLKTDSPGSLDKCRQSGRLFRLVLSRLQVTLTELGSKRELIEKDF